jgi:glycosyltransferase involved in cell wall biosynthesis
MTKLSVVLATRNEEENIGKCLDAVKDIADEIIIFDEYSTDKTRDIAEKYGAKVFLEKHHDIFHITKQKAIDKASGGWILQLDADEIVTPDLANEITKVLELSDNDILERRPMDLGKWDLFQRHVRVVEERDGKLGNEDGEVVAFFIPRRNMFLGKPLIHAGVYPDAVIRLIKKDKAHLPAKSVHEQMKLDGKVAWLFNDLLHYDSPTLRRYFSRLNRYTDLHANELKDSNVSKKVNGFISYVFIKPVYTFTSLFFRHRGYLDGLRGFMWSALSASHYPIAYFKYLTND